MGADNYCSKTGILEAEWPGLPATENVQTTPTPDIHTNELYLVTPSGDTPTSSLTPTGLKEPRVSKECFILAQISLCALGTLFLAMTLILLVSLGVVSYASWSGDLDNSLVEHYAVVDFTHNDTKVETVVGTVSASHTVYLRVDLPPFETVRVLTCLSPATSKGVSAEASVDALPLLVPSLSNSAVSSDRVISSSVPFWEAVDIPRCQSDDKSSHQSTLVVCDLPQERQVWIAITAPAVHNEHQNSYRFEYALTVSLEPCDYCSCDYFWSIHNALKTLLVAIVGLILMTSACFASTLLGFMANCVSRMRRNYEFECSSKEPEVVETLRDCDFAYSAVPQDIQ